jgi:hypothetical protein
LRSAIGSEFDPYDTDSLGVLKSLRDTLLPRLKSKDKDERKSAENWLRIGIFWLAEKRSVQLWSVAEIISSAFFEEKKSASRFVSRAIRKGRLNELKLAVAMTSLGNEMVAKAMSDRDAARQMANSLQIQLGAAKSDIEILNAELAGTRVELEQKSETVKLVKTQLENDRHHWGHDLSETKAGLRVLPGERVAPLLTDAIDALEIIPSAPHIAIKRLKSILSIIEETTPANVLFWGQSEHRRFKIGRTNAIKLFKLPS